MNGLNGAPSTADATVPVVNVHAARTFRAPTFMENKIKVWFTLLEAQFVSSQITDDDMKYCHTISSLTERAIGQLDDVLVDPPTTNKYLELKAKMIERFTESNSSRVRKLMESEQMGDQKPSEFYRSLRSLAPAGADEEFVLDVWKTRIPAQLQPVMAVTSEKDVNTVLKLADAVHEVSVANSKQISAVDNYSLLAEQIKQLTLTVNEVVRQRDRSRSRGPSRKRNNRANTPARDTDGRLCYYHHRYREKARKCRGDCSWSGNDDRRQ